MSVTTTHETSLMDQVEAATTGAVVFDRSELGVLKFSGETRLDLIQRMSTQDVIGLKRGMGAATVLTSDIGRIIDRLLLYASSDAVYVLTGEGNGDNIARYLMRFVFFNDDFHLQDLSAETAVLAVHGVDAPERLRLAGFGDVNLPRHHWRQVDLDGVEAYLHATDPLEGHGYFVMCAVNDRGAVMERLTGAGCVPGSEDGYEYLRIRAGLPRLRHELTLDYIPLETGLWDDVSFDKGCYIGQEIIARMESRGRLAKKLVRLRAAAPLKVGATITAGGRKVGSVTSAATGPGGTLALGYVKTAALEAEGELLADKIPVNLFP